MATAHTTINQSPEDALYFAILEKVLEKFEALSCIGLMRDYAEFAYYKTTDADRHSSLAAFSAQVHVSDIQKERLSYLAGTAFAHLTRTNVYQVLDTVTVRIEHAPHLILNVPIEFDTSNQNQIGLWSRKNIHPELLLTFRVDPWSLGGCGISWYGTRRDYSLPYYIENYRQALREKLQTL